MMNVSNNYPYIHKTPHQKAKPQEKNTSTAQSKSANPLYSLSFCSAARAMVKVAPKVQADPTEYEETKIKYKNAPTDNVYFLLDKADKKELHPQVLKTSNNNFLISKLVNDDIAMCERAYETNQELIDIYVKTKDSTEEALKEAKPGDVFEVGGQLYITPDGESTTELKITKQDYFELFPPVNRFTSTQGKIGDCYLVASLNGAYANPFGRVELLKMFERKGDDIFVKLPAAKESVLMKDGDLPVGTDEKTLMGDPKGLMMLEYAYGVHLVEENKEEYRQYLIRENKEEELKEFEKESKKPTYNKVALVDIFPEFFEIKTDNPISKITLFGEAPEIAKLTKRYPYATNAEYLRVSSRESEVARILDFKTERALVNIKSPEDENKYIFNTDGVKSFFEENSKKPNAAFYAGTKKTRTPETPINIEKDIFSNHTYRVEPQKDGTLNITNPYNCTMQNNITFDDFSEYFMTLFATAYGK